MMKVRNAYLVVLLLVVLAPYAHARQLVPPSMFPDGLFEFVTDGRLTARSASENLSFGIGDDTYLYSFTKTDGTTTASISALGAITGSALTVSGTITGSALEVSEGVVYTGHQTISAAADTLTGTDHIIQIDASGNSVNITLPAVASNDGKVYVFEVKTDPGVNTITLTANAAELIDGANTYTSLDTQYQAVYLYCTGTDWRVVAEAGMGSSDPLYVDHIASADTTECPILGEGAGANLNAGAEGNVIIGNQAADAAANANFERNIAIGQDAMGAVNNTAGGNVALGWQAMFGSAVTISDYNVAAGYQSLYSVTTASDAVGIGYQSLHSSTTGANIGIGYQALKANIAGQDNVAIGYGAADAAADAGFDNNVAIGMNAMGAVNGAAAGNIAIGNNALLGSASTTGGSNIVFGTSSGQCLTSGSSNLFAGCSAGKNVAQGSNNILLGHNVGFNGSGATFSDNIGIGREVLRGTGGTGAFNFAAGYNTLECQGSGIHGSYNLAMGHEAGKVATHAGFSDNILLGRKAMGAITGAAANNIAFGREALCGSAATTGDHCLAAGYRSLYSHTTGNSVIGLGKWSGYLNTTQSNALYLGGWNGAAQSPLDHRWEVTTLTADHHIDDFQVNRVTIYEAPLVHDIDGLVVDRLQVESAAGITLKPTAVAPGNPTTGVVIYFLTPGNDVISKDSSGNTVVIAAMP